MARTAIPTTAVPITGVAPPAQTNGDATNDHVVKLTGGSVLLEVQNTGAGSAHTVVIPTPGTVDGIAIADVEVSVPKESTRVIAISETEAVVQPGGQVFVDIDSTELKFRAYRL